MSALQKLRAQIAKERCLEDTIEAGRQALEVYAAYNRSGFISPNERENLKRLEADLRGYCVRLVECFDMGLTVINEKGRRGA